MSTQEQQERNDKLAIVFDDSPGHETGRFVEVERNGESVSIGEWEEREDGYWELVLDPEYAAASELRDTLADFTAWLEREREDGRLELHGNEDGYESFIARAEDALPDEEA